LLTGIDCVEPVLGQGAEFECDLAIEFTTAKEYRDVGEVVLGLGDRMELRN
jgi:hypothetical protein